MKKVQQKGEKVVPKREIDVLLDQYGTHHQNPTNKMIHWICIPLILFSVLGLMWAIPFPHLDFLGKYNGFLNWASFFIAFSGYYYYRLSPVLTYMMILIVFAMSLLVVQLEKWEIAGGPALWLVCTVIFIAAFIGQFIGSRLEVKKSTFTEDVKFLLIGPIWLLHFICVKTGIRY